MRRLLHVILAVLACGVVLSGSGSAFGQANNNNGGQNNGGQNNGGQNGNTGGNTNSGGTGITPAGVVISSDGVLRMKTFVDRTGDLTRTRIAESRARLAPELGKPAKLRKISLPRLEVAVAERLAAGKEPTEEMKALAGLTRLQYVFYYPETKDIVIAGPAEGFFTDFAGRTIGLDSGRAVVELQDVVAALRAFPPSTRGVHEIGVSIDPTQEGLVRLQQYLSSGEGAVRPGNDAGAVMEGMKRALGLHNVTVRGVSPKTHFAQVMVEADYRMKLIGIGLEAPPVRMATYIDRASASEGSKNAMQRWFFTPNYDCVKVADDDLAMELVGQGVKLIGEGELVAASGARVAGPGQSKASSLFCQAFTTNYPQIANRSPVYGQLKNLIDIAIAAAFIQKQDYYSQAGWKMEVFGEEGQYRIETYETPKAVETAVNVVFKGSRIMKPVGGGVSMEPTRAVQTDHRLKDDKGAVKQAHDSIKPDALAQGQWWWD
jgi:hypothetical protein